ncbi:MAG: allene oxide cyclase barrel-like domain-containing protein [Propionibacteriaceae bacterium]
MRSKLKAGTASVLLLLVAGAAVASAGSSTSKRSSNRDHGVSVFSLVGREVDSAWLDFGDPPGETSVGDQFHYTSDLIQLPRPGVGPPPPGAGVPQETKIGEDGGSCAVVRIAGGATTYHCAGTNSLPLGQITAQGLVTYGPEEDVRQKPYSWAITGGTGKYRGARGAVRIQELSAEEFRVTFRIIL